jgi:hypothetical protein
VKRTMAILGATILLAGCDAGVSGTVHTVGPAISTPAAPTFAGAPSGPAATATADATDAVESSPPSPAFEDITLKGTGKKVATFTFPEEAAAIAVISHEGTGTFIVHSVNASGGRIEGLVDTIGDYSGTVLFDADIEEHTVAFAIDADGAWTITIRPVTSASVWNPTTPLAGTGDNVYQLVPPSGMVLLDLAYEGADPFNIHALGPDGMSGLANEIGDFSGRVWLPESSVLMEVDADSGSWSIKPE